MDSTHKGPSMQGVDVFFIVSLSKLFFMCIFLFWMVRCGIWGRCIDWLIYYKTHLSPCGLMTPYGERAASTLAQVMAWCLTTASHMTHLLQNLFNSPWLSDAILCLRKRAASTLAQLMAWCLPTPNHYLNQCDITQIEFCNIHLGVALRDVSKISILKMV